MDLVSDKNHCYKQKCASTQSPFLWFHRLILASSFLMQLQHPTILICVCCFFLYIVNEITVKYGNNSRLNLRWSFPQNNTLLSRIMCTSFNSKVQIFLYIPRVLETLLKDTYFYGLLVNTRVNTFLPGTHLPKIPYDKYFHITYLLADVLQNRCS